jgi:hypothetical protein
MAKNRAKAYIYGSKKKKRLAAGKKRTYIFQIVLQPRKRKRTYMVTRKKRLVAVIEMNIHIGECMPYHVPSEPFTVTAASNSFSITFAFCISVFVDNTVVTCIASCMHVTIEYYT